MKNKIKKVIENFIDFLLPELTPYEVVIYLFFLRNTILKDELEIRIGKRSLAKSLGIGARSEKMSYEQVTKVLSSLEKKKCIKIGDTIREGTLYSIVLPEEIPLVSEKIIKIKSNNISEDYFNDDDKRKEIFERDNWTCQYCGQIVNQDNATLDHFIPQHAGGKHTKSNLRTCCIMCNSIKSGKTYEDAAPFILRSIKDRNIRNSN